MTKEIHESGGISMGKAEKTKKANEVQTVSELLDKWEEELNKEKEDEYGFHYQFPLESSRQIRLISVVRYLLESVGAHSLVRGYDLCDYNKFMSILTGGGDDKK